MAAKHNALSAQKVKTLTKPGTYADGNGLTLRADANGKRWVQRLTIGGKARNLGLGPYPAVSLAQARQMALDSLQTVREGRDPIAEKQAAKEAARNPAPSTPTFAEAAARVIELRRPTWGNPKHAAQWSSTLQTYAYPVIGGKPVDAITAADVLSVLTPVWATKPETASRVRQRMETVMDWVITSGWRLDNPAGKALLKVLPNTKKLKEHHTALDYWKVSAALRKVRLSTAYPLTKLAFQLLVLCASRSAEIRFASWSEIDLESGTWTIPASRMKAGKEHRVPLSRQALETLEDARMIGGGEGLFSPRRVLARP